MQLPVYSHAYPNARKLASARKKSPVQGTFAHARALRGLLLLTVGLLGLGSGVVHWFARRPRRTLSST